MNDDESTSRKKGDKAEAGSAGDNKNKSDSEEPKPRIVLTFRSEKSNTKTANMKIVSSEEKQEVSPRRSGRARGKWDWVCDSDASISPKKDKSQPVSENDESDSSHTAKRSRRRSRDDNILASAIARKEKYNETDPAPTQRLSRRIKPTAKILANEELRMGLESQNNARLGIQAEKVEEGVRTRRSARPQPTEVEKPKPVQKLIQEEVVELDSDSQNSDMKLQHLTKLGLKAREPEVEREDDSKELEEEEEIEGAAEEEEIDDDSEVISKLLEADEQSLEEIEQSAEELDEESGDDDEFLCTVASAKGSRPRRSTRLNSSFGHNDSDRSSPVQEDGVKPTRRSGRLHDPGRRTRPRRKRRHSDEDAALDGECDDGSNPAGAEDGKEADGPPDRSAVVAKCFCEAPSSVYADPNQLTEPVFCQAIETVEGARVGCSHGARRSAGELAALLRAGPRAPYVLACELHANMLAQHLCCPVCGLFCAQGIFYQCSEGHLFHTECALPADKAAGCPHCGVHARHWRPANTACVRVCVRMTAGNKRLFLPEQREQCNQAYLGFSTKPKPEDFSIPVDLLPSAKDLKLMCAKPAAVPCSPEDLCDAIFAKEPLQTLMPKILSCRSLSARVDRAWGGTCVHAASGAAHAAALHALASCARLDDTDAHLRTPLMIAVLALLDKAELKPKKRDKTPESMDVDKDTDSQESSQEAAKDNDDEQHQPNRDDLMKVIKYLVAAGVEVNLSDCEGLTPLHVAARHGSLEVCEVLLHARDVCVDPRDEGGWTPLVWAAEHGHTHVLKLLLSHGASATSVDAEGNSAVHWCALAGVAAPLQILLAAAPGAAHTPNVHTDTPLHIAARQGHYVCVVSLLAHGAKSDVENSAGELPIDVATGACQRALALNMQMRAALRSQPSQYRLLTSDISNGREPHPVPCVNEVDSEPAPADFVYVARHLTPHPVHVDTTIQSLQGCTCTGGTCGRSESCACVTLGVRRWWRGGRLAPDFPYHDPPMLFQCNDTCRCNPKLCDNSVISRLCAHGSVFVRCEVYRASGARGWGLRAAAAIPRGTPLAAYVGEVLPMSKADARTQDAYMFALDVKQDLLEQCGDGGAEALCVDAARWGGAARFMNHSCAPSAAPVRVFTSTRDLRLPAVTLFATRDIQPGEPLTFDYGDKFWSEKSKFMRCECGAPECRYPSVNT